MYTYTFGELKLFLRISLLLGITSSHSLNEISLEVSKTKQKFYHKFKKSGNTLRMYHWRLSVVGENNTTQRETILNRYIAVTFGLVSKSLFSSCADTKIQPLFLLHKERDTTVRGRVFHPLKPTGKGTNRQV